MRAANKVEAGILDHLYIAKKAAVCHRITPARTVLMDICALEIIMLSVEEEPLVRRELEPAETQWRLEVVHRLALVQHSRLHRVKIRVIGMPKPWVRDHLAGLVEVRCRMRPNDLG